MNGDSKLRECELFVVQYVPDLVRSECVNIGVFLHSPQENYLGCMFTHDFKRIKRLHPQADLEFLRALQEDFEKQIEEHEDDIESYLQSMQSSFSNLIQLAEPRRCLLADPSSEIQNAFARYVDAGGTKVQLEDTRFRIKQKLIAVLSIAGVWNRLEKRIPAARWTHSGDPFIFDFGYKPLVVGGKPNGHLQFIHALSMKRDNEVAAVLKDRILKVRSQERAELVAVVEAPPAAGDAVAHSTQTILEEAGIRIQPLSGVTDYVQSVRRELMM